MASRSPPAAPAFPFLNPSSASMAAESCHNRPRNEVMTGDGINYVRALAKADVSIAMGTGTDVAMNGAHVTLIKGDLRATWITPHPSQSSVNGMKQKLSFAFLYNAPGVQIAADVLYPITECLFSP